MAAVMMESFVSVEGILSHLEDGDIGVIDCSLEALLELVPSHWAEIAENLSKIESLSEKTDADFAKKASLLASKVFFHIQSYEEALDHALSAGDLFSLEEESEYVQKLTEQCIDTYKSHQQRQYAYDKGLVDVQGDEEEEKQIDGRIVHIVERMLERCYETGNYRHAVGIAVECRRLDHVGRAINESSESVEILDYCFEICETTITSRIFRDEILTLIVSIYEKLPDKNYANICRTYFYLGKPMEISRILWELARQNDESSQLLAYQVSFDLAEYQNERFQRNIFHFLPQPPRDALGEDEPAKPTPGGDAADGAAPGDDADEPAAEEPVETVARPVDNENWSPDLVGIWRKLGSILLGETVIPLQLQFLFSKCDTDLLILKQIKENISERDSVLNHSLLMTNAIMHCGTAIDQFLRDNLDWWGRASHWAKFSGVASLGMIHFRHLEASKSVLERFLPGAGGGPYQEGGSLYGLGLIHCGDSSDKTSHDIRAYLLDRLQQASNEILQHGGCLGLGLAALGSQDPLYLKAIKEILYHDRAVPGEAAGIALGLLLTGGIDETTGDVSLHEKWFEEMINYAHETSHEKIIRGLVMGIAIMYYDFGEKADKVISTLIKDDNETIRYGGCYTIGMAYACTANNKAIALLLHLAVSDVSDNVRRAAVSNIGFVLANKPNQVPKVVQLLSNSYNTHVRYGAAAAIGIACASTGNTQAVYILKKMANEDPTDYVRQAALMSLGMVLQEQNEKENSAVREVRNDIFMKIIKQKRKRPHDMNVMGAIYGIGLMDASGRNSIISLCTGGTQKRMAAIIGMAMFWQHWYWYPLIPFITLCFQPTMLMSLNKDLAMPQMTFKSDAPASLFAYTEKMKEEDTKKKVKIETAVLSTTAKTKARELKRQKTKKGGVTTDDGSDGDGDVQMKDTPGGTETADGSVEASEKKGTSEDVKEEAFEILDNPCRVTLRQRKFIKWNDSRFTPVLKSKDNQYYGIIMVQDNQPDEGIKLVETKAPDTGGVHGNEPKPPKPFKYTGN